MDWRAVRRTFEARFTASRMAQDYVSLYESIATVRGTSAPESVATLSQPQSQVEEHLLPLGRFLALTDIVRVADEYHYVRASSALGMTIAHVCSNPAMYISGRKSLRQHRRSGYIAILDCFTPKSRHFVSVSGMRLNRPQPMLPSSVYSAKTTRFSRSI